MKYASHIIDQIIVGSGEIGLDVESERTSEPGQSFFHDLDTFGEEEAWARKCRRK